VLAVQKARAFRQRGHAWAMTAINRGPSQMRTLKRRWIGTPHSTIATQRACCTNDFMALAEWRELQQLQAQLGRSLCH